MAPLGRLLRNRLPGKGHHFELAKAHMPGIGFAPCGAKAAEYVSDLQLWSTARQSIASQSVRGGHRSRVLLQPALQCLIL